MQMIRWMCGVSMKDKTDKCRIEKDGWESSLIVIRSGRLRWYEHVMKKNDEEKR